MSISVRHIQAGLNELLNCMCCHYGLSTHWSISENVPEDCFATSKRQMCHQQDPVTQIQIEGLCEENFFSFG